jgi:16S rRNA (uracil1498-N3)-methyltransferase
MHRFYLAPERCGGETLHLEGREAHHGLHVLRLRQDERVTVLDGAGGEYLCEVRETTRKAVTLAVVEQRRVDAPLCHIHLLQALPKAKAFEWVVQKATELGAHRIVPLLSERVVAHLDTEQREHKSDKWRLLAIEALKQSGAPWLPRIEAPARLSDVLARRESFDLALVASLQPDSRHPRPCFEACQAARGAAPRSVALWIGPEGDFTAAELNAIQAAGAVPITLGPHVLRSETAALYALSIASYELQARPA